MVVSKCIKKMKAEKAIIAVHIFIMNFASLNISEMFIDKQFYQNLKIHLSVSI